MVAMVLGGTAGRSVLGLGPVALQAPKYFSMVARARSGVTLPITTMVVRSGRKVAAWNART
jgi:hypothetical protein